MLTCSILLREISDFFNIKYGTWVCFRCSVIEYLPTQNNEENKNIFWICFLFFLWGIASSMVFTLLPIFIVKKLGGGYGAFGLLEGGVIAISFISKMLGGILIDILKNKWRMLKIGAALTICGKFVIALSYSVIFAFIAKTIDRMAKGFRAAATDTILAQGTTKYGMAYSEKFVMNTAGSLTGSIITSCLVTITNENFRLIFILAIIPTILAYFILIKKIKVTHINQISQQEKWSIENIKNMPKEYWQYVAMIGILMFGRYSEGFITMHAHEILPNNTSNLPIFMAMYEICIVCIALPIGKLSDKIDKKVILLLGTAILCITDIIAIFAYNNLMVVFMYVGAGLHMGMTHGLLGSVIAQTSSKPLAGTAFAIYYAINSFCLFFSNTCAGAFANAFKYFGVTQSSGPFFQGFLASALVCIYILKLLKKKQM